MGRLVCRSAIVPAAAHAAGLPADVFDALLDLIESEDGDLDPVYRLIGLEFERSLPVAGPDPSLGIFYDESRPCRRHLWPRRAT